MNYNNQICHTHSVDTIATYLSGKFVKRLFDSYEGKNYLVYVKCLAEISNWSREFYDLYNDNEDNWRSFENSKEMINNNAVQRDDFLLAWGEKRINQFFAQKVNEKEYSQEYSTTSKAPQKLPLELISVPKGKKEHQMGKRRIYALALFLSCPFKTFLH